MQITYLLPLFSLALAAPNPTTTAPPNASITPAPLADRNIIDSLVGDVTSGFGAVTSDLAAAVTDVEGVFSTIASAGKGFYSSAAVVFSADISSLESVLATATGAAASSASADLSKAQGMYTSAVAAMATATAGPTTPTGAASSVGASRSVLLGAGAATLVTVLGLAFV